MELFKSLLPYGDLIFFLCQCAVAVIMVVLSAKFASKKDVNAAQARADSAHHRIDLVEKDIKGLPSYDVTNRIERELSDLNGSRERNGALIERALTKLDDIELFLRTNK